MRTSNKLMLFTLLLINLVGWILLTSSIHNEPTVIELLDEASTLATKEGDYTTSICIDFLTLEITEGNISEVAELVSTFINETEDFTDEK